MATMLDREWVGEGTHRLRAGRAPRHRRRPVRRTGRPARGSAVRFAVALGAAHGTVPRPDRRAGGRRRTHAEAQARHQRPGAPRPQPGRRGQGVGHARRALGRAHPPGVRARCSRPEGAPGVRRRARRAGRPLRRRPAGDPPAVGGSRSRGRVVVTAARAAPARCLARRNVAVGAAARRPPGRRLAPELLHPRRRAGRAGGDRGLGPRSTIARSTPSTSARWSPTCSRATASPMSWPRSSPPGAPTSTPPPSSRSASLPSATTLARFVDAGASKFVLVPVVEPAGVGRGSWPQSPTACSTCRRSRTRPC